MKNIFKFTAIALIALTLTNCKKDKDKDYQVNREYDPNSEKKPVHHKNI